MSDASSSANHDRLEQVLAGYLHAVEAGQAPDREQFIARHPDLADELKSFFANRAALERLAEPLRGAALEPTIVSTPGGTADDSQRLRYFGDYELLVEIARGGMGVVYKAHQVSLNRVVAVKMILAGQLADDSAVRRFRQEAEAAANLDHPHIVPVFEVGEHQGQQYFSMGFIEGESLAEKLTGGPLVPRDAAALMVQVARAVQYAHSRGVIHRDLKPANVLLDRDNRPRVTDFGLAKVVSAEQSLTDTGQVLGTPGYMPPEQVYGQAAGPQADVYGLGAILYALLTGRPPFQAASVMETLLQVRTADPVSPRLLNANVPRDLDTIVRKCLEKGPAARYQTAQEFADELDRFLVGESIHARPPGLVERSMRWLAKQQRSVLTATAAAVASALLIVGGIVGTLAYHRSLEGNLKLVTDHERLVASVFDEGDRHAVEPFTVPTEQPIALAEGTYRLQVSGQNMLSEDFSVRLDRGEKTTHTVSLDWQQLWPEQAIGTSRTAGTGGSANWHLVHCRGRERPAHLLVLDAEHALEPTIELRDPAAGKTAWSVKPERPPELELAKVSWLDSRGGGFNYEPSGIGQTDFRPYVLPAAPQLDGDHQGMGDILIALRHQPAVLAFSSADGHLLWCYAATLPENLVLPRGGNAMWFGAVVGEPQVVADIDGDGVSDLIACLLVLEAGPAEKPLEIPDQPRRTIDAVSGKTGKQIWQYELDDRWFDLPKGVEIPLASRWFAIPPLVGGTSGSDWIAPHGNIFRNYVYRISGSGDHIFRQSPPLLMREQGESVVACVAGTRVVVLDVQTGQPVSSPHDLGFAPVRPPQTADVNGDGDDDLVLVERVGDSTFQTYMHAAVERTSPRQRLWCWSPSNQQPVWPPVEQSADFEKHVRINQPPPSWPLIADLNGDGRAEIIVPDGTSTNFGPKPISDRNARAWGELQMIDGADGKERWRLRLQTVDQQVDQLIVGPDVNGDGWRDIFTATLFGRDVHVRSPQLYVDAISGRDGRPLWHSGWPIPGNPALEEVFVDVLNWWSAGPDGWPQLVVSVRHGGALGEPIVLACFSAGSGRITHESTTLDPPLVADGDGDGVDDLFCFTPSYRPTADRGGKLFSFRGTSPRVWRRLGADWQAGRDYDGDGFDDVVATSVQEIQGEQRIIALSGRTGRELYRTPVEASLWNGTGPTIRPLAVDLDGDGVCDLLTTANNGNNANNPPPILAFSGKTGRRLWQALGASEVRQTLFVRAIDLDADGQPEVVYVAEQLLQDDAASQAKWHTPVWLIVLDGRTGKLRWKQQISEGSNLAGDMIYDGEVPLAMADLNADGVADIVTPVFLEGLQLELRAYDGITGNLLWRRETSPQQGSGYGAHWFSWKRTPIPLADDLDGDGRPEVVCLDYVSLGKSAYRVTVIDGGSGATRWSHEISGAGADWPWHDRPRPLAVSLGERQRGVVYWNWDRTSGVGEVGGEVVVLRADGIEHWRFQRMAGTSGFSPRPWVADLDRDGRDELVLINAGGVEALDLAIRQRLWRHECPPSFQIAIRAITASDKSKTPVVEVIAGRTLLGLSGEDGRPLWTCAGLPREFDLHQPTNNFAQRLGSTEDRFPPSFLCNVRLGAGDTICLQAVPASGRVVIESTRSVPSTTAPRDPRFMRLLPWQVSAWLPYSPTWLAMGLFLFLPTLILLPAWMLYTLTWLRLWSLKAWLLLPLVVLLLVIAFTVPTPSPAPGAGTVESRCFVALFLLPIAAFPGQLAAWLRMGHKRRFFCWLGISAAITLLVGTVIYAVHWRMTPSDEYWVYNFRSSYPFLLGLYFSATLCVSTVVIKHCLWRPIMNYFRLHRTVTT